MVNFRSLSGNPLAALGNFEQVSGNQLADYGNFGYPSATSGTQLPCTKQFEKVHAALMALNPQVNLSILVKGVCELAPMTLERKGFRN